jgi:hypothetical protein
MVAQKSVYVSITGLRVRPGIPTLRFWWLTIPAMAQARKTAGNISADARSIGGFQHTLSVWENEASMRAFLVVGAHKKAMSASRSIGAGRTYGFISDHIPAWAEALQLWQKYGGEI